ncbi:MAG TPA: hypothetical protein VLT33_32850 [Labilithrix sp.]|nr:hypothetical protein [Labilithrix sp.]
MKLGLTTLLALGALAAPLVARAQDEPLAPVVVAPAPAPAAPAPMPLAAPIAEQPGASPATPRYDYFRFGLGFRIGYIADPAFDTFASNDVLAQVSLEGTYAFYTKGKLAIAAGLAWDNGSRSSGARGLTTRLTVNRLAVPVEARWYFAPWLDGFVKVAPGVASYMVRVEDPSSAASLGDAPWVVAADLSAGATLRLAGGSDHSARRARLWLTTEIGYGITSSHSLRPGPNRDESDVLGSDEATKLGSLAVNGAFWRTGLAVSF